MGSNKFPKNVPDKTIFQTEDDIYYIYISSDNSWNRLPGVDQLGIATELKDGLMSSADLKKLEDLIIPPPQTSIKGEQCSTAYKDGSIGLYTGDDYLNIKDTLTTLNAGNITENAFDLHRNTYGIDWTVNIENLFQDIEKLGNLRKRAIQGNKGSKGKKGNDGIDKLDTGPVGDVGETGLNAPWQGSIIPEAINFEQIKANSNRAIVDLTTEEISDSENYLVVKRANIGNVDASPTLINPMDGESPWIMVLDLKASQAQKIIENAACTDRIVCRSTTSSIYYLNMESILQSFENRFNELLDILKQTKEQIVVDWLQVMVKMFVQQKAAICCALENCRSRKRNQDEKRYIEQARIQAAQANLNIEIDNPADRIIVDLNTDRSCQVISTNAGSVTFGDADDCNDCAVRIVVDGASNAGNESNAVAFSLPAGEYIINMEDCCINDSALKAKWNGRLNVKFNHQSISTAGNGPVTVRTINLLDCGDYEDLEDARTNYIGTTTQISHAGGNIYIWSPDKYPQDNEGSITLCFKKIECYGDDLGTAEEETDESIFVYKDSLSGDNFLGMILPFIGPIDAIANYGYGQGTDPKGPSFQYGCGISPKQTTLFFYDGSDGLSFTTANGRFDQARNVINYDYEIINNSFDMSVLVSDESNELQKVTSITKLTDAEVRLNENIAIAQDIINGEDVVFSLKEEAEEILALLGTGYKIATFGDQFKIVPLSTQTGNVTLPTPILPSVITGPNLFSGNWNSNFDADGGVIGHFDRGVNAPWVMNLLLNNPGTNNIAKICSRDYNDIYVPLNPSKIGLPVSVQGENIYANPIFATTFEAGEGLKITIDGAVGYRGIVRGSGNTVFTNSTTFSADGWRLNEGGTSTTTIFNVNQFFLTFGSGTSINTFQKMHYISPTNYGNFGLVMRFEYDDGTVEEIMPLTSDSFMSIVKMGYSRPVAVIDRSQRLLAAQKTNFQDSPMCDPAAYANSNGPGGWATSSPTNFYGKPDIDKICNRILLSYLRVKKSGKLYLYVNDKDGNRAPSVQGKGQAGGLPAARNVGQFDVLLNKCPASYFDDELDPIPDFTISGQEFNVSPTTPFCEGDGGDGATKLIFTKFREGCQMSWQKIEWYERGWRIGACCGSYVEIDGQKWLVVKRSIGVDVECGGGENANEECIATFGPRYGHPAIAWPSVDGDEFFGRPTSGSTTFIYDKDLSTRLLDKMNKDDVFESKGDITNIPIILFPKI